MIAIQRAIEELKHVQTNLRLRWARSDEIARKVIETDEDRIARALRLLVEFQQGQELARRHRLERRAHR